MNDSGPADTLRAIFRTLPGGGLRLRKPPTAKIDQQVLRQIFGPAHSLKNIDREKPNPTKPAAGRGSLRVVPRTPKK
jgi:hypothetical protein